jgi:lysophospholipase L1-like esterase
MRRILLIATGLAIASCSREPTPLEAQPSHVSMFGDTDVTITGDFSSIGTIREVTIGGVRGLDLRVGDHAVTVHLQGSPVAGSAQIRVVGDSDFVFDDGAFSFDEPSVPPRWMALGASLTQGMQSSGLDARGQLHGYASQVARAAGVFLAPALASDCLFPPLAASQFVTNCETTYDPGAVVTNLLACVTDPATHEVDLRRGRMDAMLQTQDLAVGGSKLRDVMYGMAGPAHAIEKIGELPDGDTDSLWTPITHPQLERIRDFDPDVAFSGDLLANDVIPAVVQTDDIHPELATPASDVATQIDSIVSTLGSLHGQYFIANLLDITALPAVSVLRKKRIDAGQDTDATFDAKLDAVRAIESAYNAAFAQSASRFSNVHVVDFATAGADVLTNGVTIGDVHLTAQRFGGLLSLDHLHFSDTGYAVMANVFIRAINATLQTHIPEVDLAAVLSDDPFSPDNLAKQGVHCTGTN